MTSVGTRSRALSKRQIRFSAAKFDADLARAYGVVWADDLFVPASEDGRYTTNVEGFFGAQQEWLANNLPERGSLLAQDEYGRPVLPKKAEQVYGKPGKTDRIGHYLDPYSGTVKTVVYRVPADTNTAEVGKKHGAVEPETGQSKSRPDVTQKGNAIIGDLRTDALHQALRERDIDDGTLLALLVLALGGKNVSIQSAAEGGHTSREVLAGGLIEGGVLRTDQDAVRKAARAMLQVALSCRDNMTNSASSRASPALQSTQNRFQPSHDRGRLREAIAVRRQRLAEREADLVAACERAVAHGAGRHIRVDDRATWDRAAWNRYIDAATQLEPKFMSEMLGLIREIERLELLAALPVTSQAPAA